MITTTDRGDSYFVDLETIEIEGDIRIECILIYDADGKEVFREYDSIGQ